MDTVSATHTDKSVPTTGKTISLDNRGLEPPEPMIRILGRLPEIGEGDVLVAHNDREPLFLYPKLAARGYAHSAERQPDGTYLVTIRKRP